MKDDIAAATGIPFMVTHAMKEALRARGFTSDDITQLTPEQAHNILRAPDNRAVREFFATITAQAQAATHDRPDPGVLQVLLVHPLGDDISGIYRYALDDPELVERMTREAVSASESGHNVYIEGRTVRRGLGPRERGGHADSVTVFALAVDSDPDKNAGWSPTVPVSLTVETSPGNAHLWFFLDKAVDANVGKRLGARLRAATGADADTGNICQPYRVAGTTNYPNKKKRERGRIVTWTRVLEFEPEVLWSQERFEEAFPELESDGGGTAAGQGQADEATIPAETMAAIQSTQKQGRGIVLWNVLLVLKDLGWTVDAIVTLLEKYPDGIASKYRGRLRREVERIYAKIKDRDQSQTKQEQPEPISAEALEKMIFPPIKYIVPEILVEGLTLFASKPKMGKSWLLLHAAIAVATGGFTLGELHCNEGDVLYCALEDSERRLRTRMYKLGLGFPKRLFLWCKLARLSAGGLDAIRKWIMDHPGARLIIIDILAMVREARKREETTYDADYQAVIELRDLANEFGLAIVIVHHTRKADAEDAFDTVSGTLGLTGAPDSVLIMKRNASGTVILHGKGRDLIEVEKAMEFNRETCIWTIIGEAAAVKRSTERTNILNVFDEATEPIGPKEIPAETGMRAMNVRRLLPKLVKEGLIEKVSYGRYQRAGARPAAQAAQEAPRREEAATRSEETSETPPSPAPADNLFGMEPLRVGRRRRRRHQ